MVAESAESTEAAEPPSHEVTKEMTTTATDLDDLRIRMQQWLSATVGGEATVGAISRPPEAGMSNMSLLFDASWTLDGQTQHAGLVARMAPDTEAVPVFPKYDLRRQFDVIRTVGERSDVPVPRMHWIEDSGDALGSPFIVMDRIDGRVPVDNPPYVFVGWYFDASPEQRRALQDASVRVLAQLHAIRDARATFPASRRPGRAGCVAQPRRRAAQVLRVDSPAGRPAHSGDRGQPSTGSRRTGRRSKARRCCRGAIRASAT